MQEDTPTFQFDAIPVHGRLLMAKRRFAHLDRLAKAAKPQQGQQWTTEMTRVWRAILKHVTDFQGLELPCLVPHVSGWHRVSVASRLAVAQIDTKARNMACRERAERRKFTAAKFADKSTGLNAMLALLRDRPAGRLAFLNHGDKVVCDALGLDEAAKQHWGAVYQGNLGGEDRWEHAD
eukprot:10561480-Alexandrium_andersonii.AAC.1